MRRVHMQILSCMQVAGADVTVYRVKDPLRPDDSPDFDEGVLDAPVITKEASNIFEIQQD